MPVALLVCEGVARSLDVRLLGMLTRGLKVRVMPMGSKWGMANRILALRDVGVSAHALLDGNFTAAPTAGEAPVPWVEGGHQLGWRWGRKEVENYLLDPFVVDRAMGLQPPKRQHYDPGRYRATLAHIRDELTVHQAARVAIALSRPQRLASLDTDLALNQGAEAEYAQAILDRLATYRDACQIDDDRVLERFRALLAEHSSSGARYRDFLRCFAGKDLATALGLAAPAFNDLPAQVLRKIEKSAPIDLLDWLPEWGALVDAIAAVP